MCTINSHGRTFGPDGCQVPVGSGTCGETKTLQIINEFKRLYEEKIQEIESSGGGDCHQEKIKLQQDWIGDLTAQNEMLVKAVEELEHEATERVHVLEEKLQQSAQSICEVMKRYREYDVTNDLLAEPLQKMFSLESDQKNLLEFIRRVREENRWDVNGLKFYEISYTDLFGSNKKNTEVEEKTEYKTCDSIKRETKLKDKEGHISELKKKLEHFNKYGDVDGLSKELESKKEECLALKKSMKDTQQALVEEIASKHDSIVQLRKECQQLEERCMQADKQTAFRDDIIKELRKEIKLLKQQLTQDEMVKLNATIDELHNDLQKTKLLQEQEEKRYREKISHLKDTIKRLACSMKEAEEKHERDIKICKICRGRAKVGFAENAEVQASPDSDDETDTVQASLDEADSEEEMETIKKRDEIIKVQGDTINLLQQEVESLKEKECDFAKDRESKCGELQTLRNRVSELENAVNDAEGKAVNLQKAVDLYLNSLNVLEASEDKYKTEIEQQKLTISNLQKALVATKQELDDIKLKSQENEHEQHGLINCFNVVMSDMEVDKEDLSKQCKYVTDEYEHLQDMNFDLELEHCTSLQDVEILENQLFKYQSLLRSSEDECNQYKNYCKKLAKQKKCYEDVVAYFKQEMGSMSEQLCNLQELLNMSNESNQEETCKLMQAYKNVQDENDKLSTQLAAAEQKADLESQMNQLHETKISELQNLISERELDLSRHDQAILNIRQSLQCSLAQNEELQSTIVKLHDTIAQLQNAVHTYEKENCRGREGTEQCWAQIRCCKQRLDDLKSALDDKTTELCKLEMAYNDQTRALKSAQMELNQIREKQKDKQRHLKTAVEDLRQKLVKSEENYCKVCCEFSNLQGQLTALARKEAVKDLEVKRYRKIVGDLKNTVIDLKKRLNETEEAGKLKDAQLEELSKEKEKEYNDLRRKLTEKLKQAQTEEARYLDLASQLEKELNSIRQELEVKTLQLNDVKRSAQEINSTKCIQLVCAQEEVNSLKEELNRILRQHCTLNAENEKLHAQSACMQGTVSKLEEKSQLLKGQLEQYLTELQSVQTEKESLVRKNYELLSELRSLQCTFNSVHKQQTRECPYLPSSQRPKKVVVSCIKSPPPTCPSPWSLGSQGTASAHDVRSPSRSPCPDADECDWYSSTFRNESEDEEEEDEEDWVTKVEHLAAQVRRTNKIWKNKMGHPDDVVSRDTKK